MEKGFDVKDFEEIIRGHYGENVVEVVEGGCIDFSLDGYKSIVSTQNMTYDEYLKIQICSLGKKYRAYFAQCYWNIPMGFKGQIEKIKGERVLFKRIFVSGMYPDGDMFDGKEDHVWMERSGFEAFGTDDCLEFFAEVYRYVKTGNGKQIDYALRNPENVKKIEAYELPSDDDLIRQAVEELVCEACYLNEHCSGVFCMLPPEVRNKLIDQMFKAMKGGKNAS